jgi:flagellar basal body-associated protein FliL
VVAAVVTIAVAAACGLLAAWALSTGSEQQAAAQPGAEQAPARDARYGYVPFGAAVANLSEGRLTRYVKVNLTLQVRNEHAAQLSELVGSGKKAIFQDWLLAYLSDKQLDEVKGGAAQAKLRRDIQDGFNSLLMDYGECRVDGILFTEFNVQ